MVDFPCSSFIRSSHLQKATTAYHDQLSIALSLFLISRKQLNRLWPQTKTLTFDGESKSPSHDRLKRNTVRHYTLLAQQHRDWLPSMPNSGFPVRQWSINWLTVHGTGRFKANLQTATIALRRWNTAKTSREGETIKATAHHERVNWCWDDLFPTTIHHQETLHCSRIRVWSN